eukprot:TRINITY_DN25593_c0_g1_i1.p1 TRINITY_DN25593_c0_g1~~TRINITY_DN25593_c0_g1_i1.p1  ORF type:complete len:526 (-),score=47.78 TRINITY_DN25593_c0_g1_i1:303-1880(-)
MRALDVLFLLLLFDALHSGLQKAAGGPSPSAFVGVNIGTDLSNLPQPSDIVALLKRLGVKHVRLFDADREMLSALANSGVQVVVGIPNNQLLSIGQSRSAAASWVNKNVAIHLPATNITAIAVGSEVLTSIPNAALVLVPAMKFIHSALVAADLDSQIKVSTPHDASLILDAFPPSQAHFNSSFSSVMKSLLEFLHDTGSYFMFNVYPYEIYMKSNGVLSLDEALFRPISANQQPVDPNTMLNYSNVFDWEIDAVYNAMSALNVSGVKVVVTESGWPSAGDPNEPDATVQNARTYNLNLIRHVLNGSGTPAHPGVPVNTYIYELFNEDLRPGANSERSYGIYSGNSTPVYDLRFDGSGSVVSANASAGSGNGLFCVALPTADSTALQAALDWACGQGKADCHDIQPGGSCYDPDTLVDHASYAFDSYFQKQNQASGSCDFNGVANITSSDPSEGSCVYPGSSVGSASGSSNSSSSENSTIANGNQTVGDEGSSTFNSSSTITSQLHIMLYPLVALPLLYTAVQPL